jgi:hypothetical protein
LRQHQGRGLGKPLLAAICERLSQLGHTRARVTTSTGRPAAVNLYLHFGFRPVIRDQAGQDLWNHMLDFLRQTGRVPNVPGEVPLNLLVGVQPPVSPGATRLSA